MSIGGADISFKMSFKNSNAFELLVDRIRYEFQLGGKPVGEGIISGDKNIESGEIRIFSLPFLLSFFELGKEEMIELRHNMQMIFQDPYGSLNPRKSIRQTLSKPFKFYQLIEKDEIESKVTELLELVALSPRSSRQLGIAVDLGTTKIAGYLLDLESCRTLASKGIMNPQIAYGEDVIARILRTGRSLAE